jgi:hypothetical protein
LASDEWLFAGDAAALACQAAFDFADVNQLVRLIETKKGRHDHSLKVERVVSVLVAVGRSTIPQPSMNRYMRGYESTG